MISHMRSLTREKIKIVPIIIFRIGIYMMDNLVFIKKSFKAKLSYQIHSHYISVLFSCVGMFWFVNIGVMLRVLFNTFKIWMKWAESSKHRIMLSFITRIAKFKFSFHRVPFPFQRSKITSPRTIESRSSIKSFPINFKYDSTCTTFQPIICPEKIRIRNDFFDHNSLIHVSNYIIRMVGCQMIHGNWWELNGSYL